MNLTYVQLVRLGQCSFPSLCFRVIHLKLKMTTVKRWKIHSRSSASIEAQAATEKDFSAFRIKNKLRMKRLTVGLLRGENLKCKRSKLVQYDTSGVKMQIKAKVRCHSVRTDGLHGKESNYQPLSSDMCRDLVVVLFCLWEPGQRGREEWPLLCVSGSISLLVPCPETEGVTGQLQERPLALPVQILDDSGYCFLDIA